MQHKPRCLRLARTSPQKHKPTYSHLMVSIASIFLLTSCQDHDYKLHLTEQPKGFTTKPQNQANSPKQNLSSNPQNDGFRQATSGVGGAQKSWQKAEKRLEEFDYIPSDSKVVDFLFVIDNSPSMVHSIEQFRIGIRSLSEQGVFPKHTNIAVLNTTPADPEDLDAPHWFIQNNDHIDLAPGFLRLVDRDSIRRYKAAVGPIKKRRFSMPGCQAWFTPTEQNLRGDLCFDAHTQINRSSGIIEAGITVTHQWLRKNQGSSLFRQGAAVNIIFISDTHDPGFRPAYKKRPQRGKAYDELLNNLADYDTLKNLIEDDNEISSLTFHAIAPESQCGDWFEHDTYFDIVDASNGVMADYCNTTDYAKVIKEVTRTGAKMQQPVFRLGHQAAEISKVTLNDQPVAYSVSKDKRALRVHQNWQKNPGKLRVHYKKLPTRPSSKPAGSLPTPTVKTKATRAAAERKQRHEK